MVQLKASAAALSASTSAYFNSFMVQLKVGQELRFDLRLLQFQFLHGTIKSSGMTKKQADEIDFNSFMVQLKEVYSFDSDAIQKDFNSFMVQLKGK